MRLVSPSFGYAVEGSGPRETLRVFSGGRWRATTPPLASRFIEDAAFTGPEHGWATVFDCARGSVSLFRTTNGRTWTALGAPAQHSCGAGPSYLSFADATHGWLESVNASAVLRATTNGGRTWRTTARLPCPGPIAFESRTSGWLSRCGAIFRTANGGRTWQRVVTGMYDLPRAGVAARLDTGKITFTSLAGRKLSSRTIGVCAERVWPESVAAARTWWVVAGGRASVTTDAGAHWKRVVARGIPKDPCAVRALSAADARKAWAVVSVPGGTALYETRNAGKSWRKI